MIWDPRKVGLAFIVGLSLGLLVAGCAENPMGTTCDPACGDFENCCDSTCVLLSNNPNHCGGCGIACASGVCQSGTCMMGGPFDSGTGGRDGGGMTGGDCRPECTVGERCCGTSCVRRSSPTGDQRTDSSFQNCNGCGIACDRERASSCSIPGGGTEGAPRCLCGEFDQCLAGDVCVSSGGTFQCVSLSTDPRNCGAIGNSCAEGESCSGGMCVCGASGGACGAGEACCGGACVDVTSDAMNCGACGNACGANGPSCVDGSCRCGSSPACRPPTAGMFPAPGDLGESCCEDACVANTDTNCGCGVACDTADDETCVVSGGSGFPGGPSGGESGVCCGMEVPFFGAMCTGGGFGGDGGMGGDGGFPFPFP